MLSQTRGTDECIAVNRALTVRSIGKILSGDLDVDGNIILTLIQLTWRIW